MYRIAVTGGNGFVGSALMKALLRQRHKPFSISRKHYELHQFEEILISGLEAESHWGDILKGCDIVVHLAARVHIMNDDSIDPLVEFRKVNTVGTLNLARQAAVSGVKRFIYLSSIKVNGESTYPGQSFSPNDIFVPDDPYGLSKYEAEQGLLALAKETGMEVVIIRPPLVYGPGVKANFAAMMKWVKKRVPLPLDAIHNQRSLVALENLVSFIIHCLDHPKAANEIFLISDGKDVSTTELLQKVAKAFGKNPYLVPVPVSLMKFVARLLGKDDIADRLFGSLKVDSSKAQDLLGWKPVISMDDELKKTVDAFLNEKNI